MANVLNKLFLRHKKDPTSARQQIFDLFVRPLLIYLWDDTKKDNWHILAEELFRSHERKIVLGRVKQNFRMPGNYVETPGQPIPGYGPRAIEVGTPLFIRVDRTEPFVDVQLANTKEEWFFRLKVSEFRAISDKIHIMENY